MPNTYDAQVHRFDRDVEHRRMTYAEAAASVRDGEAAAILLDMLDPEGLEAWWSQSSFPEIIRHRNFPSAATSGIAIGGLQRLEGEDLVIALIDYFAYAAQVNAQLRQTNMVKLCIDELGADSVRIGDWAEMPMASRREFTRNEKGTYSVGPHCDAIHFGRDVDHWPVKEAYTDGTDQISTVLTINEASNSAGIVLWDLKPATRPELDAVQAEFRETNDIAALKERGSVTVRASAGQMTVLNTRYLHAVEQCVTPRRTIGAFLAWHDNQWHMFH